MPSSKVAPELHEPYEKYPYAKLRHELSVRQIHTPRSGPQHGRVGFIKLLRDWDEIDSGVKTEEEKKKRTRQSPRLSKKPKPQQTSQMSSTRAVRARRGCRFRLINVLLNPDFNPRWGEMTQTKTEVNQLWLDVHAAFMAQNSMLDALHFQDALFVNVTPNIILSHSAARLQQMWTEIVSMYRNAVVQSKEAAAHNDTAHSFFDFCAGRLDLLYLHMAMLLEPKLYEFIMSDKLPAAEPFSRSKGKVAATTKMAQDATDVKPEAATKASTAVKQAPGKGKAAASPARTPSTTLAHVPATVAISANNAKPIGVLMQNPEMKEPPTQADPKTSTTTEGPPKTIAATLNKSAAKAKQAKPSVPPYKPAAQKKPPKAVGKVKSPSGAASAKETKAKALPFKQKPTASPPKPKAPIKPLPKKSSVSSKPVNAQTPPTVKRPREEEGAAIVEVPSVSDIVPHSGKRVRTTTATTISTALATRPADLMLPPDEWDILESRLRKVNENIDRCHRGLASAEVNVSDGYKQSLEADLRFYSAIKQRLQEQLLVVMQSGY